MASCRRIIFTAVLTVYLLAPGQVRADRHPDGVEVVEDAPGRIVLEVTVPAPVWRDDLPGGRYPTLPGYGLRMQAGEPVLPQVILRLAIPEGVALRLETEILESRLLQGQAMIAPRVERQADAAAPAGPGRAVLRAAHRAPARAYPFPASPATLTGRARIRDLPVVGLRLTPVRVIDAAGRIEVTRRFRVVLAWDAVSPSTEVPPASPAERAFRSVYRHGVANAAGARRHRVQRGRGRVPAVTSGGALMAPTAETTAAPPTLTGASTVPAAASPPVMRRSLTLSPLGGSSVYRLSVSQDGIHRLDHSWLGANAPDILLHPTAAVFLQAGGVELPVRVVDGGDGVWSPGDHLEFWGEAVDDDPFDADQWQSGDFTDTRAYTLGVAAGSRLRTSTAVSGAPVAGAPLAASFTETVRSETNTTFLNTVPSDDAERWYDTFLLASSPAADFAVTLPGLVGAGSAALEVRLLGNTFGGNPLGLHRTRIQINGIVEDQADWDGLAIYTHGVDGGAVTFPASDLASNTTLRVDLPLDRLDGGGLPLTADLVWVDWLQISYPRDFTAGNDHLVFEVTNQATRFAVSGLGSADAAVYDVTPTAGGLSAPLHLSGAVVSGSGPFTVTFEIDPLDVAGPTRRLAVFAGAVLTPDSAALHGPQSDLSSGGADWLLIGHDALLDLAPTSALSDLVAVRQSQGLITRVVPLREVYDQFTFGIEDPQAIRDLIHWALVNWSPGPTFVVLVGDATFDYHNDFGHATVRNLLPTYMASQVGSPDLTYFSEDNKFAAVLGDDDLADLLLGRLPTHTLAETEATFAKIVAYEAITPGPPWTRRTFFISDADSGGFESTQRFVIDGHFDRPENPGVLDAVGPCFATGNCRNNQIGAGPIFHTASFQALMDRNPASPPSVLSPTMNQWIRDGINAESGTTMFIGHGGFQSWGRDATILRSRSFAPDDIDALTNITTPTFMININCITGGFHTDSKVGSGVDQLYSFAEDFLVTADRGGVGVLAPSHLTFTTVLAPASNALWGALLGQDPRERLFGGLNLILRLAFDQLGATSDVRSYAFLGDPASRLVLPDPAPAGVPSAGAGNGVVNLSWSPGGGTTFLVERSVGEPTGPYTVITPPGHAATTFADGTVANGTTYWYRVIARDGDGMDAIPSNRNQDCPSGPDCVQATPLNPVPPGTPTGLAAVDAGTGGVVRLTWDAAPEPDIDFFRVRHGPSLGSYPFEVRFGAGKTSGDLRELTDGQPVFMVIEAVNTSGLTSPASAPPATATPHLVLGIAPPRPVIDLTVNQDGADNLLSWSRVVLDIYDRPTTVATYPVFASASGPLFPLDEAHRLASVPDTAAPSYRHVGAAVGPETRFYLIVGRDTDGFDSASGQALPASVLDMRVVRLGGGMLRLSWSPVSLDRLGNPLVVDHYMLYASPQPFSRADTDLMTPVAPLVTATTIDLPEGADEYFSVLVVDQRGSVSPF